VIQIVFVRGIVDPFVYLDGEDVRERCLRLELLPGGRAALTLLPPGPAQWEVDPPRTGDVLGLHRDARIAKQTVEGEYVVEVA